MRSARTVRSRRSGARHRHASVELWDAVKAGNHVRALELHQKLRDAVECRRLRQSAGLHALRAVFAGLRKRWSGAPMPEASAAQQAAIKTALEGLGLLGGKQVAGGGIGLAPDAGRVTATPSRSSSVRERRGLIPRTQTRG